MPIVADEYTFVIGVDTPAATHALALVTAATRAVVEQSVFPNTSPGLDRALNWVSRRIPEQPALIVIDGAGSYRAGLAQRGSDAGLLVAEPSAMPDVVMSARPTRDGRGLYRTLGSDGRHHPFAMATDRRPAGGVEIFHNPQRRFLGLADLLCDVA